ncbi:HTTM domain-containing protein [Hymenobacter terricola]|uniref:HTTM domain-containing protein n=1 Tax=Hymenobacter terricola TaxID=2819236 RepID=UPI001B301512|nr:HTTM domain-containing protein [Hymenobacter terricola]
MTTVLHNLSFPERLNLHHPLAVATVLAAAVVILTPRSIGPFLALLCFSLGNTFEWMPDEPNHLLFEFILNAGILAALLWTLARHYFAPAPKAAVGSPAGRMALFHAWAPFARISLLVLYFYAVFHKLNWDYFNLNISCSTFLLDWYAGKAPFLVHSLMSRGAAVWGTIAVEALIPLLLGFRKTRWAGILLGIGFHFFLSIHPHPGLYSFSALMFAVYTLFLPADFPEKALHLAQRLFGRALPRLLLMLRTLGAIGIVGVVGLAASGISSPVIGLLIWLGWGLLLGVTYLLVISTSRHTSQSSAALFRVRPALFWGVPLLVFLNGLSPYLGLKTQTSFSMFSNLRTEGDISNHLLVPASLQITDLEKNLIETTATNLDELKPYVASHELLTPFEFRRIASGASHDFYATYVQGQQPQTIRVVNGISNQPRLTIPINWLVAKLVRFRPVNKGPCLCKH